MWTAKIIGTERNNDAGHIRVTLLFSNKRTIKKVWTFDAHAHFSQNKLKRAILNYLEKLNKLDNMETDVNKMVKNVIKPKKGLIARIFGR